MAAPFRIRRAPGPAVNAQGNPPVFHAALGGAPYDSYWERLIKLIPAEIVAIYPAVSGHIPPKDHASVIGWAVICLGLIVALRLWLTRDPAVSKGPQWPLILISCISFCIWLYTLDGTLVEVLFGAHKPHIGMILVVTWTFVIPGIYTGD